MDLPNLFDSNKFSIPHTIDIPEPPPYIVSAIQGAGIATAEYIGNGFMRLWKVTKHVN